MAEFIVFTSTGSDYYNEPSTYEFHDGVLTVHDNGPYTKPPRVITYAPGHWIRLERREYIDFDARHPDTNGAPSTWPPLARPPADVPAGGGRDDDAVRPDADV